MRTSQKRHQVRSPVCDVFSFFYRTDFKASIGFGHLIYIKEINIKITYLQRVTIKIKNDCTDKQKHPPSTSKKIAKGNISQDNLINIKVFTT